MARGLIDAQDGLDEILILPFGCPVFGIPSPCLLGLVTVDLRRHTVLVLDCLDASGVHELKRYLARNEIDVDLLLRVWVLESVLGQGRRKVLRRDSSVSCSERLVRVPGSTPIPPPATNT